MSRFCSILLFLTFHVLSVFSEEETTTVTAEPNNTPFSSSISTTTTPPPLPTTAAKLVRYRRQPPRTIVKHVIRASKRTRPRRRIKRPKVKYGPPNYSFGEPLSYYKPRFPHSPPAVEPPPSFSINDFQHLNLDAADFELPPSSYETQSMDLDFYSHDESASYVVPKATNLDYATYDIESPDQPPSYTSYVPSKPEISAPRIPHKTYGVPKQYVYADGDGGGGGEFPSNLDTLSLDDDYSPPHTSTGWHTQSSYEPPRLSYDPPKHEYRPSSYGKPASKPPSQYHPVVKHRPVSYSPPTDYQPPEPDSYQLYDKKIHNSGYLPPPSSTNTDIEITYSPSYEVNLPPSNQDHPRNNYQIPDESQPGNFAEPPGPAPSDHESRPAEPPTSQQNHSPAEDYLPPSQELPLNPHHKPPTYDFPKSSYEVPIYDPIPFDASNHEQQEFFPPQLYDDSGNQYERPTQAHGPEPDQNQGHRQDQAQPDVPLSDTELVREENNVILQYHPSPTPDVSTENYADDTQPLSSSIRPRRQRKRKRGRGSSTTHSPKKHILDVPELEQAFEAENRHKYHHTSIDPDVNESNRVEEKHNYQVSQTTTTTKPTIYANEHYVSNAWNPLRIRTSLGTFASTSNSQPTVVPSTQTISSSSNPRLRVPFKSRQRPSATQRTTENYPTSTTEMTKTNSHSPKEAIVSIQKSQSQSYYDGILAPSSLPGTTNTQNSQRTRLNRFKSFTRPPASSLTSAKEPSSMPKRTTKSVFDTTHFKSPRNDKTAQRPLPAPEQNLPKNHKLF